MACHTPARPTPHGHKEVLLIGPPNVGKSVIFNQLTGMNVSMANYAGTTVDIARGTGRFGEFPVSLVDLPGTYTLAASNQAEEVATDMLAGPADLVLIVADAVHLESSLFLILQVLEAGHPSIVILNRIDVALRRGISVDAGLLAERLGVPVVPTVAVRSEGFDALREEVVQILRDPREPKPLQGDPWEIAEDLCRVVQHAPAGDDSDLHDLPPHGAPPHPRRRIRFGENALIQPWPGLLIAAVALLTAVGVIVGLGMGMRQILLLPLVRGYLFPFLRSLVTALVGQEMIRNILIGEYGLLIKGIEWPFTLVLPYVISFYLVISIMEDTGYLPRFAVLLDGAFGKIGLRGSHSISLLLGYGCAIPGILSSRAMGSRKERIILATMISLAVPCISQTGAIFALLAEASLLLVPVIFLLSFAVMIGAGLILDRLVPGTRSRLVYEMPVLLVPQRRVILRKMIGQIRHYIIDGALPMVVAVGIASVLYETGILAYLGRFFAPLVTGWLRLPEEAAVPLVLGVVRRELTVLPLLDMGLSPVQLLVGASVGLFYVPCIAVVATLSREFGVRIAFGHLLLTVATAFLVGGFIARVGALF
ncbi:ferrous iron transport protein B [Alkalispirochaeta americana]|uniref:Ferrous iron transport protein B n=1 Tax=Alkalispirochaeta americana TaxID=159291 RepID=A0A1N6PU36_9SPIO|nr:ferrous iron transporter B [Alkalispirochaeta americana]SIQ07822.1 ferrous iron transport protein B [Alkalispirochaeta americana]